MNFMKFTVEPCFLNLNMPEGNILPVWTCISHINFHFNVIFYLHLFICLQLKLNSLRRSSEFLDRIRREEKRLQLDVKLKGPVVVNF
jgi:hypothetical protein